MAILTKGGDHAGIWHQSRGGVRAVGLIACVAVLGSGVAAASDCPEDQPLFMSCLIEGRERAVTLCRGDRSVSYRYGPINAEPELTLQRDFGNGAEAVPWPGVGRTVFETVLLRNADVTYEVYGGFDRFRAAEEPDVDTRFGGIIVTQDGRGEIAHLRCRDGSVDYAF